MILLFLALLALAVLAPLLLVLRSRTDLRGARELALDLHTTQLRELDRDLAEARILPVEHQTARLEIQRRLLAAANTAEPPSRPGASWPILLSALLIPAAGVALYFASGAHPQMPSSDHSPQARQIEETVLLETLRDRLDQMDPASDRAREGYALLGKIEATRGTFAAAAAAYRTALTGKFDPIIALNAAEASVQADGGVTDATANLYQRALAAVPTAPWRQAVENRLAQPRIQSH